MTPLPDPYRAPEELVESVFERYIDDATERPRSRRFALGLVLFGGYLGFALFLSRGIGLFLALGFYGSLIRWVLEEPKPGQVADAHVWAALTFLIVLVSSAIWWWDVGPEWLQSWAGRVWFPLGIVAITLALDRYRRKSTAAVSIGEAFAGTKRCPRAEAEDQESTSAEA